MSNANEAGRRQVVCISSLCNNDINKYHEIISVR